MSRFEAFDRFCQINGLMLQQTYNDERFVDSPRPICPYVVYDGSHFELWLTISCGLESRFVGSVLKQAPAKPTDELSFGFMVCAEPKLPILQTGPCASRLCL